MSRRYRRELQDLRWIKKRQGIFNRDNHKCTICGSKKKIQVHHTFYYRIRVDPWLYPDKNLITLCDDCHLKWHRENETLIKENKQRIKNKKTRKSKLEKAIGKYNWFLNKFKN